MKIMTIKFTSMFNFDEEVSREGTHAYKLEAPRTKYHNQDIISLGCADFEICTPKPIQESLIRRINH